MKRYHQLTLEERSVIGHLRHRGKSSSEIARQLGRHRSTICREVKRNITHYDGAYRAYRAQKYANGRRRRSRSHGHYTAADYQLVRKYLKQAWSPEQIHGYFTRAGIRMMSHETMYKYIWFDKREEGTLYKYLRHGQKQRRKRYGRYDSRGRLASKRPIWLRPLSVESRETKGHWEIDTMVGPIGSGTCILTLVERKTGFVEIGYLPDRSVASVNRCLLKLIRRHPGKFKTITADNGCEFHGYAQVEAVTGIKFYFSRPYHSWERGSNENTNGLIRQYVPKKQAMTYLTQRRCDHIADKLNSRPRKRHDFRTPAAGFYGHCRTPYSHFPAAHRPEVLVDHPENTNPAELNRRNKLNRR